MGTEILMAGVEKRQFQCINDTADCVDESADEKPPERRGRKCLNNPGECKYTDPAHGDIKHRGKPFWAGNPTGFDDDSDHCDGPHQSKQCPTGPISQNYHTDRCISAGDQDKDHHMVDFAQYPVDVGRDVKCMVNGAGCVQQYHTADEDCQCHGGKNAGLMVCFEEKRDCRRHGKHHADEMSNSAAGVFDAKLLHIITSIY